jgi:Uma2 family endonuclease
MITALEQLDLNGKYNYADYLTWRFDQFIELLRGRVMPMSAPKRVHQRISVKLVRMIDAFLSANPCGCEVYSAPFDVRLPSGKFSSDKEIYTVVQPDLCVICDPEKLDERGCLGAPDLIVEIISENSAKRDLKDKFVLYAESGVREYWIVRPEEQSVTQFIAENGKYSFVNTFTQEDIIAAIVLPEMKIDLSEVFQQQS